MNIKPKGFHIGGKSTINERAAFRYGENRYTPLEYPCYYPKKVIMKRMLRLIKETEMTSSNESFPVPAAWSVVDTIIGSLKLCRAKNHETIDRIAREDERNRLELENHIADIEEFKGIVVVK